MVPAQKPPAAAQGDSPVKPAIIRLDAAGQCPFLEGTGLCEVHRRFGHRTLGRVCQEYPRLTSTFDGRRETTATLSCPEIARICLLTPQGITEAPSPHPPGALHESPGDPRPSEAPLYHQQARDIRGVLLQLLNRPGGSLDQRLFSMAYFADEIRDIHFDQMTSPGIDAIARTVDSLAEPGAIMALDSYWLNNRTPPGFTLGMVYLTLVARCKSNTRFTGLVTRCLQPYGKQAADLESGINRETDSAHFKHDPEMLAVYLKNKIAINRLDPKRIDMYFNNLIHSYLYQHHFTCHPNLSAYLSRVFCYIAIIRFLFYSHPKVVALAKTNLDTGSVTQEKDATLDAAIVEVVYLFFRNIEHNLDFKKRIDTALEQNEMSELGNLMALTQF